MAMNLAPHLKQQFFDSNGDPLAGGKIYTYQSGTSTPQATYTDSGGGTANANPIILDANGECHMWLDPTLSYKFVIANSSDVTQTTKDSVIGLISAGTINTASLIDLSVTTAKLADDSVTAAKLKDSASVDGDRAVTSNHIRDSAITRAKMASASFIAPTLTKYTSGTGTHNRAYAFVITSGSATAGATYTNNGITYTVIYTIASGTVLHASGASTPSTSGTLTKATGTGDATLTFSAFVIPTYLRVRLVGGGGGGGGSGTASYGSGGAGGNTTFGTALLSGAGGTGGATGTYEGGAGGTASLGTGPIGTAFTGGTGSGSGQFGNTLFMNGGMGASTPFAGGGGGGGSGIAGKAAPVNSGAGGGGGGVTNVAGNIFGPGGGAGGYVDALIVGQIDVSYPYAVGAAGAAGTAGTNGFAGGAGGLGYIEVTEFFQ